MGGAGGASGDKGHSPSLPPPAPLSLALASRYGPPSYSPRLAGALEGLGRYLVAVGRLADAAPVHDELNDMLSEYLPPTHPLCVRQRLRVVKLCFARERYAAAQVRP